MGKSSGTLDFCMTVKWGLTGGLCPLFTLPFALCSPCPLPQVLQLRMDMEQVQEGMKESGCVLGLGFCGTLNSSPSSCFFLSYQSGRETSKVR